MNVQVRIPAAVPLFVAAACLIYVSCDQTVEPPRIPQAESVKSIVVMTRTADSHPQVMHIDGRDPIAEIVNFVESELGDWHVPADIDEGDAVTTAAFEGEDERIVFYLFIGRDWVGADDPDGAGKRIRVARVDPDTVRALALKLNPTANGSS